ncbi:MULTISPECIES: hypothetical protein [Saccharopolyspora]|uniref:Uncharacterized protein n=1 Tax=Saccharopolyspora cebuensis TaxID=418759 RepID=A0ABV4CRM6_9PSEU
MDSTPIYTELRETLMDPEDTDWGQSSPPEFAAALTERSNRSKAETAKAGKATSGSRSRSRRHRADD